MEKNCELKIRGHLHGVFLFILLFVSGICGNNVYSQEKRLTIEMSVSMHNSTLKEVLDVVLGKKYSFNIQGRYIMVRKKDQKGNEETPVYVELKGKVKDEQGNPLPGVSIVVKGTNIGVATDVNGEFKLVVL